jgi:hypothetical protein
MKLLPINLTLQTSTKANKNIEQKGCTQQKYCCNWGMTLKQSSSVHIQALYPADGILLGISS